MKKILLVISDNKNFHYITEELFKTRHTVLYAETEEQAFALLEQNPVNLLILTPHLRSAGKRKTQSADCFRFLERFKTFKPGSGAIKPPAMIASSFVNAEVAAKAKAAGVSDIIRLPFDLMFFEDKVAENLLKTAKPHEKPDPVTGLPKRRLGEERIADMLRSGKKGALILIDLDHYSFLSTAVSDKAMITCRNIIQEEADDKTVLAVTKGGGFLIFVQNLRDREKVERYAEKLIKRMLSRVNTETVFVSMGLAVSDRHGKNYEDLYFACDRGLGEARRLGKNTAKFYSW